MADRPILFSAPMVRALLAGTKTQTRRLLSLRRYRGFSEFGVSDTPRYDWHLRDKQLRWHDLRHAGLLQLLPVQKGDRLWVKETWCDANSDAGPIVCYRADFHRWQPPYTGPDEGRGPSFDYDKYPGNWSIWAGDLEAGTTKGWRSGRFMPRWPSRLTLHVADVRIQRLQDISEEDAKAEGIERIAVVGGNAWRDYAGGDGFNIHDPGGPASRSYASLWKAINGTGTWADNPWVIAYTFLVERANVDQARDAA